MAETLLGEVTAPDREGLFEEADKAAKKYFGEAQKYEVEISYVREYEEIFGNPWTVKRGYSAEKSAEPVGVSE